MSGESPPVALVQLVRRNRRRYGGYLVHVGMAVLFVGVAASSSFKTTRDVDLKPGDSARVGAYTVRYEKPVATAGAEKISFGAVLAIAKHGRPIGHMTTSRGFYPTEDPSFGPIGRFFEGEATSEVALRSGPTHDLWTVINPDLQPIRAAIDRGDRIFERALTTARNRGDSNAIRTLFTARDQAIAGLARRWETRPWAAPFRVISSPLVMWIWLGGIIVFTGGLIALWPVPAASRGRVRARYAARVGRELAERSA